MIDLSKLFEGASVLALLLLASTARPAAGGKMMGMKNMMMMMMGEGGSKGKGGSNMMMMMMGKGSKGKGGGSREPKEVETDVVIVGAGAAGIRAAVRLQEVAPDLDFVVLESTNRIGGRMKSAYDLGVEGNSGWTVEDGAMWLNNNSVVYKLAREYGIKMTVSNFSESLEATYIYDASDGVSEKVNSP